MRRLRLIYLALAFSIALLSTFLISFIVAVPLVKLIIVFAIVLVSSLALIYLVLNMMVIKDMEKVESLIPALFEENIKLANPDPNYFFYRFKQIDDTIRSIARGKRIEIEELEKISDFRREFIANISHELKTPIFSAQGFVHTLLDGAVKDKNVRTKFLKKAAKSLDALDMLVQDLLTLSQIEIGDIRMHFEYFDIVKLTKEVAEQLEEQAEKKKITINVRPREKQILVYADYRRMHQVMNNLLTNAIKYNNDDGIVKINFNESRDFVEIRVADNGEGIPEEDLTRIFERFYRVEKSRSRSGGGTGLGLAIVKHVVDGHKSEVKVSSKLGKGTVFSFKLSKGEEVIEEIA